jgi:oligopeptide/dipeptide ABC transporter ATP-binding protein
VSADLEVRGLSVAYGDHRVVHDVSLTARAGRTLALVGESGSGKSSLALAIARLLPSTASIEGSVRLGDVDLTALEGRELRHARGRLVAYVPQDAMAALNPTQTAGRQIAQVVELQSGVSRHDAARGALELLEQVRMPRREDVARRYPHELSGGMRQRVMIAIGLAGRPQLLIADEPTTALDVTVQAGILELARELQAAGDTTFIWITHDFGVVAEIADEVTVMYGGRAVEQAGVTAVFDRAAHPYTRALVRLPAESREGAPKSPFTAIPGSPPARVLPSGCAFHPRCPLALALCAEVVPGDVVMGPGHLAACHRAGEPA